ncbi:MAG: hypothetical protein ACFFAU_12345 [Candidatus Hodarchaeota archaeon]
MSENIEDFEIQIPYLVTLSSIISNHQKKALELKEFLTFDDFL